MLRSHLLIASSFAVLASFASVACGGDDTATTTEGGGAGGGSTNNSSSASTAGTGAGGGGTGEVVGLPPGPPPETAPDGEGQAYAVNKFYAGDTDRTGTPTATAWKKFGFNLDQKVSAGTSKGGHCKAASGGTQANIQTDGENGIDNAFGSTILPKLVPLVGEPSALATDAIASGDFTLILQLEKLGAGANYNPMKAQLFGGAVLGSTPAFDGNDEWPLIPELLNGGSATDSKIKFGTSYVVDNLWVSGEPQTITVNLSFGQIVVNLDINKALIAMDISDRANVKNGVIGGIVPVEPLITQIKTLAKNFDKTFCDENNSTLVTVINSIRAGADIMKDGSQNENETCDGISIGLGFEMKPVKLGPVAEPAVAPADPCSG